MHRGVHVLAVDGGVVDGVHRREAAITASGTFPVGALRINQRAIVLRAADDLAAGGAFAGTAVELRHAQIIIEILPGGIGIGVRGEYIVGAIEPTVIAEIHHRV